jgi:hypothetical protein
MIKSPTLSDGSKVRLIPTDTSLAKNRRHMAH